MLPSIHQNIRHPMSDILMNEGGRRGVARVNVSDIKRLVDFAFFFKLESLSYKISASRL